MTHIPKTKADWWEAFSFTVTRTATTITALGVFCTLFWQIFGGTIKEFVSEQFDLAANSVLIAELQKTQQSQALTQSEQAITQRQQAETLAQINVANTKNAENIAILAESQKQAFEQMAEMQSRDREGRTAPVRFLQEGNMISNGKIGEFVTFTIRYIKSRDCGRPISTAFFRNGGGITHAFRNKSTTAEDGRGSSGIISNEAQTARFVARIPEDEGVEPTVNTPEGYAVGWVILSWPDCPNAPEVRSPLVPFQIEERV